MATVKTIDVALRANTEQWEAGLARGSSSLNKFSNEANRIASAMGKTASMFQQGALSPKEYSDAIGKLTRDLDANAAGFGNMAGAMSRADGIIRKLETDTERYENELRELGQLLKVGALSQDQYRMAVERTTTAHNKASAAASGNASKMSLVESAAASLIGPLSLGAAAFTTFHNATRLAGAAMRSVQAQFKIVGDAKDAADGIGIATGALLKLRFAVGEVTGMDASGVDAILKKMNLEIAEAAIKGGEGAKAIERMGLSVRDLSAMTPEKAFTTIVDAISKLDGAGTKSAAAMAIFGKQGQALLPIFNDSAEALKDASNFAERVGLKLSEIDASAIEAAGDEMARMKAIMDGMSRQVAAELAPQIIAFSRTLQGSTKENAAQIGKLRNAFSNLGAVMALAIDLSFTLEERLKLLSSAFPALSAIQGLSKLGELTSKASAGLGAVPGSTTKILEEYKKNLELAQKEIAAATADAKPIVGEGVAESARAMEDAAKQQEAAAKKTANAHKSLIAEQRKLEYSAHQQRMQLLDEFNSKQVAAWRQMNPALAAQGDYLKSVAQINDLHERGLITLQKRNELLRMQSGEFEAKRFQSPAMAGADDSMKGMRDRAESIKQSIETPFERFTKAAAEIMQLRKKNLLDPKQAVAAMQQAQEQFRSSMKLGEGFAPTVSPPAAIERGTQEAFSAFQKNMGNQNSVDEKQLAEQKKQTDELKKINKRGVVLAAANL